MAQLVVRDLEEKVKRRLKQRAAKHGRSLEGEVRHILCRSVNASPKRKKVQEKGLGTQLAELFAGKVPPGFKIKKVRGVWARPMEFDE